MPAESGVSSQREILSVIRMLAVNNSAAFLADRIGVRGDPGGAPQTRVVPRRCAAPRWRASKRRAALE